MPFAAALVGALMATAVHGADVDHAFQSATGRVSQLRPIDEAVQEPALVALRDQLLRLAGEKSDRDIRAFMTAELRTKVPAPLSFEALRRALSLGGSFTTSRGAVLGRREFCAPYTYSAFPELVQLTPELGGEADYWVVTGSRVPVRARPSVDAPVQSYLSYAIVRLTEAEILKDARGRPEWAIVALRGNAKGYVPAALVRNTVDYAVCFAKVNERWLMTVFNKRFPPAAY